MVQNENKINNVLNNTDNTNNKNNKNNNNSKNENVSKKNNKKNENNIAILDEKKVALSKKDSDSTTSSCNKNSNSFNASNKSEENDNLTETNSSEKNDENLIETNDPGKMFIGGLSWQTTAENLRDYFYKFGEVNECMVMRNPQTKRARGFGFITFVDIKCVEKVLAEKTHILDGKHIDPKIAFPKRTQPKMIIKTKKVFIGGLSSTSTLEDMKNYFQQYGKIEDAMLMFDKSTQRHRGFGFITFDDDEISDKVCEIHFHEINGKMVECKKAQPKEVMLPVQINKTRAAAARNFYGLAPEQLLAYASYIPKIAPYPNTGVLYPATLFNGLSPALTLPTGLSRNNSDTNASLTSIPNGNTHANENLIHQRNLAAVQLVAQQQAVYDAALAYASSINSRNGQPGSNNSAASDFANATFHPVAAVAAAAAANHHHNQQQTCLSHHNAPPPTATTHHFSATHQHPGNSHFLTQHSSSTVSVSANQHLLNGNNGLHHFHHSQLHQQHQQNHGHLQISHYLNNNNFAHKM